MMKAFISQTDKETLKNINLVFDMFLQGYTLKTMSTENKCLKTITIRHPDLIILDCDFLHDDVFRILKEARSVSQVPIVCLSDARRDGINMVKVLEAGADQYHTKPIRQLEFIARIRVLLRRV
jgi:two-component system, OmpR family, KDP operon response regulator KdpE